MASGSVGEWNFDNWQFTLRKLGQYGPLLGLIGLYIIFAFLTGDFLTYGNQLNILRRSSVIGILAIGVTFPLLCAEIDLSIAQVMAFSGLLMAALATGARAFGEVPVWLSIIIGIGAAAALGIISGYMTSRFDIPSFMSTLAILFLADGLGLLVSNNRPIIGLPQSLLFLGSGNLFGFPTIVITFLVLLIISQFILSYTRFGRYIYAIGGDQEAAELMGINVVRVRMSVLVISAVFSGIAGLVLIGRLGSAVPTMGESLLLPPIAAVILGGTNLFGGSGNMAGTLVGVLILGVLANGLNLLGIGPAGQLVAQGIVLLIAVFANVVTRR